MLVRKLYGPIMGREMVCISQRNHSRNVDLVLFRRRDLLLWMKSRFKSTQVRLLQSLSVLKEVGRKGLSEGILAREWEDQKKTQEDEGQIEASVERRRKYEKLGELISLWDRVKGISKELKTSVAPGSEKLKEAERLLENLINKEKKCGGDLKKLARELTNGKVSAEELVYLCKLHAAKCALQRERDIQLSASRPKRETKMGMRLSVGQRLLQRIEKGAKGRGAHQDAAGKEWGKNEDCQKGMTALLERDRCREELALLQVELARLVRWPDKTFKTLESSIQAWEKKVAERKAGCEEYGKAVEEGDVGRRNELDRVVPEKGYTAYPDANTLDVFKGVVYLLKKRLEEHRQLEQRWVADGLSIL
ncbi:uncharacterized protein IAS62_005672 [Cryptococcus decagattii]|uniref:Uncharacterized protein n=1 Tax=Cryptococcus decagattii TaxID=1859122 RepID=A0ABZ2B0I4_9TREE